jgi:ubiquitin-activating enzyme E1 C
MSFDNTERSYQGVEQLLQGIGPYNEFPDDYNPPDAIAAIRNSKILIIGAGGLGCEILKNVAMTGFRDIHIIDMDTIDISNLNRQFLFRKQHLGQAKATIAAEMVQEIVNDSNIVVTPYYCRIQDKSPLFYQEFDIVISGLDSVEARRWINLVLVGLADDKLIPLIDGGTEGFRGQSRVIYPTISSCYECTLNLLPKKVSYPVCTIANTPRVPEHCIEYASEIEWPKTFPNKKFDADDPEDVQWMFETAKARADFFKIDGVTRLLTLGVVKNIIPSIASTNAIIAASCCNEAFKIITGNNPNLDNYMMYSGDEGIFTYTYSHTKKPDCPVCGNEAKVVKTSENWTLDRFIEFIKELPHLQLKHPSITTANKYLYLTNPPSLEEATKGNLELSLAELISNGEELSVTDPDLPLTMKLKVEFTAPEQRSLIT